MTAIYSKNSGQGREALTPHVGVNLRFAEHTWLINTISSTVQVFPKRRYVYIRDDLLEITRDYYRLLEITRDYYRLLEITRDC